MPGPGGPGGPGGGRGGPGMGGPGMGRPPRRGWGGPPPRRRGCCGCLMTMTMGALILVGVFAAMFLFL